MDEAEKWLYLNDPNYREKCDEWRHVKTGEYVPPPQEIPWGNADDLERLVSEGKGRFVTSSPWRECEQCQVEFLPQTSWHRFCTRACNEKARRERRV